MSRARDLANSADNDITGTLTVDDITLSGNITVGGTVDGRDIATDGTKLDGIEANATADQTGAEIKAAYEGEADTNAFTDAEKTKLSGIEAGATADQTKADIDALNINADTLDGQHGSYYTSYADTAVANLVDTAPSTLDTLNELAAALGDDPNFSTTVTNNIATKLPLAGGTMTGAITFAAGQTFDGRDVSADGSKLDGIEAGATADQTASEILTLIKTVDGSGSGLDADTLDGVNGASYLRSDTADTMSGSTLLFTGSANEFIEYNGSAADPYFRFKTNGINNGYIQFQSGGTAYFWNDRQSNGFRIDGNGPYYGVNGNYYPLWHSGNDGSGSGLDADTLDGVQGSSFMRSDQATSSSGNITANSTAVMGRHPSYTSYAAWYVSGESDYRLLAAAGSDTFINSLGSGTIYFRNNNVNKATIDSSGNFTATGNVTAYSDERLKSNIKTIEGAVDTVKALRGVTFEKDGKDSLGVIAQEVQKVLPEVVLEGEEYLSVAYGNMVGLLIEAIKEQQAQIDELKAKLGD